MMNNRTVSECTCTAWGVFNDTAWSTDHFFLATFFSLNDYYSRFCTWTCNLDSVTPGYFVETTASYLFVCVCVFLLLLLLLLLFCCYTCLPGFLKMGPLSSHAFFFFCRSKTASPFSFILSPLFFIILNLFRAIKHAIWCHFTKSVQDFSGHIFKNLVTGKWAYCLFLPNTSFVVKICKKFNIHLKLRLKKKIKIDFLGNMSPVQTTPPPHSRTLLITHPTPPPPPSPLPLQEISVGTICKWATDQIPMATDRLSQIPTKCTSLTGLVLSN